MKMVKSLLLGTAAGLVGVAEVQAADLPVKAKPVEYVKICSVYGEGFFYIPGTDTCIKIGGYVRQNFGVGQAGGSLAPKATSGFGRDNPLDQASWAMQSSFVTSVDVRTPTEYGTLRAFTRAGFRVESENYDYGTYYVERAFTSSAAGPLAAPRRSSTSEAARSVTSKCSPAAARRLRAAACSAPTPGASATV